MATRKDVIVIGAGAIGCSIAYHLGRRGISTCIVERESIGTRASAKAWAVFTYPTIGSGDGADRYYSVRFGAMS